MGDFVTDKKALIILGIKHSGKTTLGNNFSKILNIPFFDVDEQIEKDVNMGVRQYFQTYGEEAFKKAEYEACKEIFNANDGCFVVATGGGICDNVQALSVLEGTKVFLDASETVCFRRILENSKKTGSLPAYISNKNPKNEDEARAIFHEFYVRRRNSYLKLADEIIEWV